MRFSDTNFPELYSRVCKYVREEGDNVAPRGQLTREVRNVTLTLDDPSRALPLGIGRWPRVAIGAAEALQLIAGAQYPETMKRVAGVFSRFTDGESFHGSYGSRTREQMPFVVKRLQDDHTTRQAVLVIWDPAKDLQFLGPNPRDIPCTVYIDFLIRKNKLEAHASMRSNDVYLGLAYDVFQFTQLQQTIANVLGVEAGRYYHHAISMHAYHRDFERIERMYDESFDIQPPVYGVGREGDNIHTVAERSRALIEGRPITNMTASETWYAEEMKPYVTASAEA